MKLFELEDVHHAYMNRFTSLEGINLTIDHGENIALLGANGSGKSTLMQVLDALIFATSGSVKAFNTILNEGLFDGEGTEFGGYFRKKVALVFQNSDVQLFNPTVYDEIAFAPLQFDMPLEDVGKRVQEVMEMLGIGHLKERAPWMLSEGEKKKVAIGSVLSANPDVLLFDEPTAGLDPRTRAWFVELVEELRKAGKTIITATHDLGISDAVASRGIVLGEDHRIAADASVRAILSDNGLLARVNLADPVKHEHTR